MAENLTAEQLKAKYIQTMGPQLGQLYDELCAQLTWLHIKWQQYRELFGKDAARVDLLNQTAPLFFGVVQDTLFDDVLLHLARLTDPSESNGRSNLSVRGIPEIIQEAGLKVEIEALLESTLESCDFARRWRNRRLAHMDLKTYRKSQPLPPASRLKVEEALGSMRNLLNRIEWHFYQDEISYQTVLEHGGADHLVEYLESGLKL